MFYCGTTSPGENPHCQAKPHPCNQRYHLPLPPAVKSEPQSTLITCPISCSHPAPSPALPLPLLLLTPCPISWDKTGLGNRRFLVGRENLEDRSRNKWLEKSQRLLVLQSKFMGLKLFTWLGPVPCPLRVTMPLPA